MQKNKILLLLLLFIMTCYVACNNKSKNKIVYTDTTIVVLGNSKYQPFISVNFPVFEKKEKINIIINSFIQDEIAAFYESLKIYNTEDSVMGRVYLQIKYKVFISENGLISIALFINSEWNGPHVTNFIKVFNYDANHDDIINLSEFIKKKNDTKLIVEVNDQLIRMGYDDCLINKNDIYNLNKFVFSDDSIYIGLDNSEIDRHCEIILVPFSFDQLESILNKESIVMKELSGAN